MSARRTTARCAGSPTRYGSASAASSTGTDDPPRMARRDGSRRGSGRSHRASRNPDPPCRRRPRALLPRDAPPLLVRHMARSHDRVLLRRHRTSGRRRTRRNAPHRRRPSRLCRPPPRRPQPRPYRLHPCELGQRPRPRRGHARLRRLPALPNRHALRPRQSVPVFLRNTIVHELLHAFLGDIFVPHPNWYQPATRAWRADSQATHLWLFHRSAAIRDAAQHYISRVAQLPR